MRKIRITESQYRRILESEEMGFPLDKKADDGKPDNFNGDKVAVDNVDKDAPNDVTIPDTIKRAKKGWFGMNRWPAFQRLPEGRELDNMQNSGFGMKSDAVINAQAKNGGGKMVQNVAGEINSNTRGSRNNTNQVRISRMEDDKENNPANFQKNGGDAMLKILKSQVDKTSTTSKAANAGTPKGQSTKNKPKSENNGVYYFK